MHFVKLPKISVRQTATYAKLSFQFLAHIHMFSMFCVPIVEVTVLYSIQVQGGHNIV